MIKKIEQLYRRMKEKWGKYWEKWEKFEKKMTLKERLNSYRDIFWNNL